MEKRSDGGASCCMIWIVGGSKLLHDESILLHLLSTQGSHIRLVSSQ